MDFIGHAAAAVSNPSFSTDAGPIQMNLQDVEFDATKTTPWERRFNPYDFNGGYVAPVDVCIYFTGFLSVSCS
jgi:hypothetical protein